MPKIINLKFIGKYCLLITLVFFAQKSFAQEFKYNQDHSETHYYTIEKGDQLFYIIKYFNLGWDETMQANPEITDPDLIDVGSEMIIPDHLIPDVKRKGIVINLAELKLYYFKHDSFLRFPITVGDDQKTPIGETKIISKRKNPYWIPPESVRIEAPNLPKVVPAGDDNPLGHYALYLDASHSAKWGDIMIHGTNDPINIGSRVSHGCIRLYAQNIEELFHAVKIGTPVTIIDQPVKIAEENGSIYLETHFNYTTDYGTREKQTKDLICKKIHDCKHKIKWQKVDEVVVNNLGIPINVAFPTFKQDYSTTLKSSI